MDIVTALNDVLPKGFVAYDSIDLGPSAFVVHTPVEGHDFNIAVGFNVDGWEIVLNRAGDAVGLPDGPNADVEDAEVVAWINDIVQSYDKRGDVHVQDWADALFVALEV